MVKFSRRHFNLLIVAAFVLTGLLVLVAGLFSQFDSYPATVRLGSQTFRANVAKTDQERARGLSGVHNIAEDEALLFVGESDSMNRIWMKDMKIAIDVVWLSRDLRIVHVEKSLQPSSFPTVYSPGRLTRYIVEIPEGSVDKHSIKVGSFAKIKYKNGDGL